MLFSCFVFFFWFLGWLCKPLWHITPPHVFKLAMDWPVQDRQASHVYNIHKHTHAGSTSHLNDGGSLRLWVCVSVCGNDVMLAGLSVENSSFGVENSSFAVWEAFVVLCRQCCYACRNVSLRINVGILSSDRREREIDQSPPPKPAGPPAQAPWLSGVIWNLPICPQHAGYDLILKHAGRLSLTVEHHQPSSLAHYTAATDKHPLCRHKRMCPCCRFHAPRGM